MITALKVAMSLILNFVAFGAHVETRTTLDPQVDPIALCTFQETMSNVAAAVSWFASKPLVGDNSIITSIARADICEILSEVTVGNVGALSLPVTMPLCISTDNKTAVVHFFGVPTRLEVAKADTQLTALIEGLLDARCILTQYKGTVGAVPYGLFFAVTDAEIVGAAKNMHDALAD